MTGDQRVVTGNVPRMVRHSVAVKTEDMPKK